ncbi:MAG: LptE family protein [Deltaproteobacteria bacterium]|nr:LptE family protein [Deltaproteobacteria bacterium]
MQGPLRSAAVAILLVAALGALAGCGYRLVSYRGALGDVRRVSIHTLRNDSLAAGYGATVTEALLDEFQRRGALQVVSDPALADLTIGGRILPIYSGARSFSSTVLALEYQVTVQIQLDVRRRDGTLVPIDPGAMTETEIYVASADAEAALTNRNEALRRVASVIAGRVHDALFERLMP